MADPRWRLRRAGAADADALALVASASFLETYAGALDGADLVAHCLANNTRERFAAWAEDAHGAVTVVEVEPGGAPMGYAVLTAPDLPGVAQDGDVELRRIYAMARLQGLGVGRAMIDRAVEDALRLGRRRVVLGVWGQNVSAHRFYERQGFNRIGTRQFRVGSTIHDDFVYGRAV